MSRSRLLVAAAAILAAALLMLAITRIARQQAAPADGVAALTSAPMPTEHRLDSDAERRNRAGRKLWIEQRHLAPPDLDWRAIERGNGLALQAARGMQPRHGEDWRWTEIGSRNLAGRMHCTALSVAGDSLYGGSDRGGVWKADLHGQGWRPLSDNVWGGVHGMAVAGAPVEVISILREDMLLCSEDQGRSWQAPAGLPAIARYFRVARDMATTSRLYLLVRQQGVGALSLWVSTDAGRSYALLRAMTPNHPQGDFWLDRRDGNAIYLMDYRTLWASLDQGLTWQQRGYFSAGIPSKVLLTGSEAGSPTLYLAAQAPSWKLYRSADAGYTWEWRYDIPDFWETVCASIENPSVVVFAGVEAWRSPDGGAHFFKVNNWWDYYSDPLNKLHADFPGLDCHWLGAEGGVFYPATDGGLYRSDNDMVTVTNVSLTGLGVSQYYDIMTSVNDPNLMLAGSQDQGYQRSTGPGPRAPIWDFTQLISGDYGHLTSSDGGHGIVYSVYPGFVLIQQGELDPTLPGSLDFPAGESYPWLPFILADPEDDHAFYFCARRLYRGVWLGGDSEAYTPSAEDFTVGGGSYLTALSIAPTDYARRIAVTDTGIIWFSSDGGANWTQSADHGPSSNWLYGTAIVHSGVDPLRAYLGGSGYGGHCVWRTDDGGESWTAMGYGLPATLVNDLALEDPASEVLYAATDAGPYRYDPQAASWSYIGGSRAPLTTYWCVEGVPAARSVRFGTYGRGIWEYAAGETTEAAPAGTAQFALASYPNPFNPKTTLRYRLAAPAQVRLTLHDAAGREVARLVSAPREAGEHTAIWNGKDSAGRDCASGVYLARLAAAGRTESLRLTLVR